MHITRCIVRDECIIQCFSRFWYVSMVACIQNESTCKWEHVKAGNLTISYDLTLVNGNPESTHHRHYFQYHFSYDTQVRHNIKVPFTICTLG